MCNLDPSTFHSLGIYLSASGDLGILCGTHGNSEADVAVPDRRVVTATIRRRQFSAKSYQQPPRSTRLPQNNRFLASACLVGQGAKKLQIPFGLGSANPKIDHSPPLVAIVLAVLR